ncbi:hypothetical protein BDZ94DRAFT_1276638 [Collybia nuda]|uniref:FAD-binding PCMH-type domain-containing protein n=1 Tax=Collybia nuda TaxID=64659 RepID=A0A9P5XSI7_9AGAR|nr:hypothetical protein BDZ94DRAFT_1276638 [Collybia nuda]
MWGLTLDTIITVNMVLANGTIVTATNERNPDLFWAARGAASSFGIVTSIEVKTFPEPPSGIIFQYEWILDVEGMAEALDIVQNYLESGIPPAVGGEINLFRGPTQGTVVFHISGGWYGPADQLNTTVAPLLQKMPEGPQTTITPGNYSESVVFLAGGSLETHAKPDHTDTFYAKSLMTPEASPMSLKARTAFAHFLANEAFVTDLKWFVQMEMYGGSNSAINSVNLDATAFAHRNSMFTVQFFASAPGSIPPFPDHGFIFMDSMLDGWMVNVDVTKLPI